MTKEDLVNEYIQLCKDFRQKRKVMLKKLAKIDKLTVTDNIVKNSNLCIILSCPGEEELIKQRVCVGKTGKNLECILKLVLPKFNEKIIGKSDSSEIRDFQEGFRYNYTIINASNVVHFRDYNGAEARDSEIKNKENIERVKKALSIIKNIEYFLVCGDKAKILFNEIKDNYPNGRCSQICHVGGVGIRKIYGNSTVLDIGSTIGDLPENERDSKRFELIARQVEYQWELK